MRIGTPKEVATLLGVHINTVYRLAQEGELPTLRRIGPRLRFDLESIEAWMRDAHPDAEQQPRTPAAQSTRPTSAAERR